MTTSKPHFLSYFFSILVHSFIGLIILLGKSILNLIPKGLIIPIISGKSKSLKWIRGSGAHSYWLGVYELKKNRLFGNSIKPGSVVYDIGAHVGFYTLIASHQVGKSGHVYAFEPNPKNITFLKKHLILNNVKNTTIIPLALSNTNGHAKFILDESNLMGRLGKQGDLEIETTTLDTLLNKKLIKPPDILKIDAEGAEYKILEGAYSLLTHYHPNIFLATHDRFYRPKTHKLCCAFLKKANYSLSPLDTNNIFSAEEIFATYSLN